MRNSIRSHLIVLVTVAVTMSGCGTPWETAQQEEGAFSAATATAVAVSTGMIAVIPTTHSRAVGAASPVPPTSSAVEIVRRVSPAVVTVVNKQEVGGLGSDLALETGRGGICRARRSWGSRHSAT